MAGACLLLTARRLSFAPMSANPTTWRQAEQQAFQNEKGSIDPVGAILGAIATTVPLMIGVATGHTQLGLFASLGGLNVALGLTAGTQSTRIRWGLTVLIGTTLAVALATLVHNIEWLTFLMTFLWVAFWSAWRIAGTAGVLTGFVTSAVFIITVGIPAPSSTLTGHTLAYLGGGAIALTLFLLFVKARPDNSEVPAKIPLRSVWTSLRGNQLVLQYSLRCALMITGVTVIYIVLHLPQGWWIAMAVLSVLQPDAGATKIRAIQRGVGTFAGAAAAAVVISFTHSQIALILCIGVVAGALFALKNLGYHWMIMLLTPIIIFMLSIASFQGWAITEARIIDTFIGIAFTVAIATLTDAIVLRERKHRSTNDAAV